MAIINYSFSKALDLLKSNLTLDGLLFNDSLNEDYSFNVEGMIKRGKKGNQMYFVFWKLPQLESKVLKDLRISISDNKQPITIEEYQTLKGLLTGIVDNLNLKKLGFPKIESSYLEEKVNLSEEIVNSKDNKAYFFGEDKRKTCVTENGIIEVLDLTEEEKKELYSAIDKTDTSKIVINWLLGVDNFKKSNGGGGAMFLENPKKKDSWVYIIYLDILKEFAILPLKNFQIDKVTLGFRIILSHKDYGQIYFNPWFNQGFYSKGKIKNMGFDFNGSVLTGLGDKVGWVLLENGNYKILPSLPKNGMNSMQLYALEDLESFGEPLELKSIPRVISNGGSVTNCLLGNSVNGKQYLIKVIDSRIFKWELSEGKEYMILEPHYFDRLYEKYEVYDNVLLFSGKAKDGTYDYYYMKGETESDLTLEPLEFGLEQSPPKLEDFIWRFNLKDGTIADARINELPQTLGSFKQASFFGRI